MSIDSSEKFIIDTRTAESQTRRVSKGLDVITEHRTIYRDRNGLVLETTQWKHMGGTMSLVSIESAAVWWNPATWGSTKKVKHDCSAYIKERGL